ncbi:hypothetical protein LshimejAT787_0505940 [Lyophyllum shimeji]|uniref:Uncharacterized protein n=1 Tax=Lyophyllum shimeji TaxID=47721 RepID=A0A9P3PNM0_LYOSH|nr:hypothetical protein LshimejAT787_0505940 [Lyophyllum shimeji]
MWNSFRSSTTAAASTGRLTPVACCSTSSAQHCRNTVGGRFVVVRVLEILEPIRVAIPGYDMRLPAPKEECLVETYRKKGNVSELVPHSFNIEKPSKLWKDLDLLA